MHGTEAYNTFRTIYNNRLSNYEYLIEAACIPHRVVMLLLPYFRNTKLSAYAYASNRLYCILCAIASFMWCRKVYSTKNKKKRKKYIHRIGFSLLWRDCHIFQRCQLYLHILYSVFGRIFIFFAFAFSFFIFFYFLLYVFYLFSLFFFYFPFCAVSCVTFSCWNHIKVQFKWTTWRIFLQWISWLWSGNFVLCEATFSKKIETTNQIILIQFHEKIWKRNEFTITIHNFKIKILDSFLSQTPTNFHRLWLDSMESNLCFASNTW